VPSVGYACDPRQRTPVEVLELQGEETYMNSKPPGIRPVRLPVPDPVESRVLTEQQKTQMAYGILNTDPSDMQGPAA
jgi:hypothetical protein